MKPDRTFLNDLNANTKAYKVKVKVIEKSRPKTSPTKGTIYQTLVLQDDKGNRMRGALFGDQVAGYKEAIVYNGVYEIANAPIKPTDPQWRRNPNDLGFQMSFGGDTVIQSLDADPKHKIPSYILISEIPKTSSREDKYDVVGLVVYVEPEARQVVSSNNRQTFVREVLVLDSCVEQPVIISAWNEASGADCENLIPIITTPTVVGFTALRVSSYKGYSLATTMSTMFIQAPPGETSKKLYQWAADNTAVLTRTNSRIRTVKSASNVDKIQNIETLLAKNINDTLQEERYWLRVKIANAELQQLNAYVGCSNCGKSTKEAIGSHHSCTTCLKADSIACARISFNCEVVDATGSLPLTAFSDHAEMLFSQRAPDLFRIKITEDQQAFYRICSKFATTTYTIQVGPKATLSRNNVLQWVLKKVIPDSTNLAIDNSEIEHQTVTHTPAEKLDIEVTNNVAMTKQPVQQVTSDCQATEPKQSTAAPTTPELTNNVVTTKQPVQQLTSDQQTTGPKQPTPAPTKPTTPEVTNNVVTTKQPVQQLTSDQQTTAPNQSTPAPTTRSVKREKGSSTSAPATGSRN